MNLVTYSQNIPSPNSQPLRGVHTGYFQVGSVSNHCLSCVNVFIWFQRIVSLTHRQSKEHTALSARLAVTIIITFTISADILFLFPVQMSCIMEYILSLCALVSRNANIIQWTVWYLKKELHFCKLLKFSSSHLQTRASTAYLISPELSTDIMLNYSKNSTVFY